jgi:large subunit ribosomal protein L25
MGQNIQLNAEKREGLGKRAVSALRAGGKVPGVVQEHGKESQSILLDGRDILKTFAGAGKSQAIDLAIGTKKNLVLIKEIQFVNLKPEVEHVVFQALKADEPVDAEVPVHIVGEVPAEANRLVLLHTLETLEVRALPKDLPEALEVSAEKLIEVDDKVLISDINLPAGVELVELLATADDEEKKEEFLSQPIAIVKEASVVESDEGVEVEEAAEGEAVDDGENQKTTDESENQD